MQIVAAAKQIIGGLIRIGEIEVVGAYSLFAGKLCLLVVAAQHIDMPRHMIHMPGIGAHFTKHIRRAHAAFRHGGHFQQMNVQVYDRRMLRNAGPVGELDRALADLERLQDI